MPIEIGIKIDEKDPVRKLVEICEELDFSEMYAVYLRRWRKIALQTMFIQRILFLHSQFSAWLTFTPQI